MSDRPTIPARFGLDILLGPARGNCVGCDAEIVAPAVVAIRPVVGGFVLCCVACAIEDLETRLAHAPERG